MMSKLVNYKSKYMPVVLSMSQTTISQQRTYLFIVLKGIQMHLIF